MASQLFQRKSLDRILADAEEPTHSLKKALSAWDLIAIGIGCIIGTGIFVLTGKVAISNAGPGIIISFIICGVTCVLAALCYAEFASLIPIAGSAYTFSYASLGEILAWIIGWDLILEYAVAASAVAQGWSSHFVAFLKLLNQRYGLSFIPMWPDRWALTPSDVVPGTGFHGLVNLPALLIVLGIGALLIVGIRESARVNNVIVVVKVCISIFFIALGLFFVNPKNWSPLVPKFVPAQAAVTDTATPGTVASPPAEAQKKTFWQTLDLEMWKVILMQFGKRVNEGFGGWAGILLGAAIIFFAYIGFDAVSTTSEEAKNPARDLPIGIIGSLVICTVLYILMAAVFTGIIRCDGTLKLDDLGTDIGAPMVYAFSQVKQPFVNKYAALLVDIGGLCGITSVLLVTLLGQSRIFFAMARDGLLPSWISKVHATFKTPYVGTAMTGAVVAVVAGFVPLKVIAEMANIGTLFAFVLVSGGIIFLRKYQPERKAAFRTPLVPFVPILSIVLCLGLMLSLPAATWLRFVVWLLLGFVVYFAYGYWHSTLRRSTGAAQA